MKEVLRQEKLEVRRVMSEQSVKEGSGAITRNLLSIPCVQQAQRVMAYCAVRNEPDMGELISELLDMGKRVALPHVAHEGIVAAEFTRDTNMVSGIFGIPQPALVKGLAPFVPDIVIVPGVVFDLKLKRIGFGMGYYDRFLENFNAVKIGVCYERQLVDCIEEEPHDVRMDFVVTEDRVLEPA